MYLNLHQFSEVKAESGIMDVFKSLQVFQGNSGATYQVLYVFKSLPVFPGNSGAWYQGCMKSLPASEVSYRGCI